MENTLFVDQYYEMDPEFEDLLPTGDLLKDGMIVLLEDRLLRVNLDHLDRHSEDRAKETNRWCVVSDVSIRRRFEHNEFGDVVGEMGALLSFVGTYPDGTKRKRTYDASYAWIVKRESI